VKRESRIHERTTHHEGYRISYVTHKLIETLFGDGKQQAATIRQLKLRGNAKVSDVFTLSMLAVNLRRWGGMFDAGVFRWSPVSSVRTVPIQPGGS
jgi:hypothetical protein